ncbi:hypothetical protein M0804_001320 [Polistes exclamans]|nr:hypothetical protein M0804_001320 [Polistes exclamans]
MNQIKGDDYDDYDDDEDEDEDEDNDNDDKHNYCNYDDKDVNEDEVDIGRLFIYPWYVNARVYINLQIHSA